MLSAGELLDLTVPCDVRAPGIARAALAAAHDGGWSLDESLLVASELVTNAVRHSGCGAVHTLTVTLGRRKGNLIIAVRDPGLSGDVAEPSGGKYPGPGGWGLDIVERLSINWGTERSDGYCVWAELASEW